MEELMLIMKSLVTMIVTSTGNNQLAPSSAYLVAALDVAGNPQAAYSLVQTGLSKTLDCNLAR